MLVPGLPLMPAGQNQRRLLLFLLMQVLQSHGANVAQTWERTDGQTLFHGCTALHMVADAGFAQAVRALVQAGAQVNARGHSVTCCC